MLDLVALVAIIAACVSVGSSVFAVLFVRRGGDADVKTDLAELALLVDRMAKTSRREKMARVRASAKQADTPAPEQVPLDYAQDSKAAIRAKVAQLRAR